MLSHKRRRGLDVLTIGSATQDIFVTSNAFESRRDMHAPDGFDACFPLGAKLPLDGLYRNTGGGATNGAVTFARFGLKTGCITRVGKDLLGDDVIHRLKEEGIQTSGIQKDDSEATGCSIILVAGTGFRSILVYRGAAKKLNGAAIPWSSLSPSWIYLTSLGGDRKLLQKIFSYAKKHRIHIAWNPGNIELERGLSELTPYLMQCDIVILNRHEAALLTDMPPRSVREILHRLGVLPRQALVITDGAQGAYLQARGNTWYAPALRAKRVNTTGAGDAFGSAFTAAAIKTGNVEIGLRAGMLNATNVIQHMGAKAGILKKFPSKKELDRVNIRKL